MSEPIMSTPYLSPPFPLVTVDPVDFRKKGPDPGIHPPRPAEGNEKNQIMLQALGERPVCPPGFSHRPLRRVLVSVPSERSADRARLDPDRVEGSG